MGLGIGRGTDCSDHFDLVALEHVPIRFVIEAHALGQADEDRVLGVEEEWLGPAELAPAGVFVSLPGATDATGQLVRPVYRTNDTGLVNGNHPPAAIDERLIAGELLVRYGRLMKVLYQQVRLVELDLGRKLISFIHRNAWNLLQLERFEEVKSLSRKTIPVARRFLGDSHDITFRLRWNYVKSLYKDSGATLDELREAVATLEEIEPTARRVMGGANPLTGQIGEALRNARATLRARETPSPR